MSTFRSSGRIQLFDNAVLGKKLGRNKSGPSTHMSRRPAVLAARLCSLSQAWSVKGMKLAIFVLTILSITSASCQETKEEPVVIYFCKGTRNCSYNSAVCTRNGPDGIPIPCPVAAPECAASTQTRSMFCERRAKCKTIQPSICSDASNYLFDETNAQVSARRDQCLNDWKTTCESYRLPSGSPAGCHASWVESPCEDKLGPEFNQPNQCRVVCGDQ